MGQAKESLISVKRVSVGEAWKILQLATSSIVQSLESLATEFSGAEKKALAIELISNFYDKVFTYVDLPIIPHFLETMLHKYVKGVLMIMVAASIDAMVTIFKNTGVFIKNSVNNGETNNGN